MRSFLRSYNEELNNADYGNSSDPCGYNSTCDIINFKDLSVQAPALIPTCILAAAIGFYGYHTISKTNVVGSKFYSLTFAMFGIMMSFAGLNDCIMSANGDPSDPAHIFTGIVDVGLTSTIGMTFAFNGLVDVGLITEGVKSFAIWGFSAGLLFGGWFYVFEAQWYMGFFYLYLVVIGVCCGLYCILELVYLIKNRTTQGLYWVGVAGLTGAIGLAAVSMSNFAVWLCMTFGCFFGPEFVWFLLSDAAMWACFKYFMSRVPAQKSKISHQEYMAVPLQELVYHQ